MDQKQLQEYRTKLENERLLLLAEIKRNEKPMDFGSDIDHGDEETDESEEVGNQLAVAQDLKMRLEDVDVALNKIHSGKYGVCEKCKKPIEKEILDIDPESRFCKNCKLGE
jgi:DnaK suppressor protein